MKYDFITLTQNECSNLSEGPFSRLEQKKRNTPHKEAFQESIRLAFFFLFKPA